MATGGVKQPTFRTACAQRTVRPHIQNKNAKQKRKTNKIPRPTKTAEGRCLPGVRPVRYLSINYPDFTPRFTL